MDAQFRRHARNRSEEDRREIARRVAIYIRQVEQTGRIRWQPNIMKPPAREGTNEPTKTENH